MEEDIKLAKLGYAGFDGGEAGFRICECFQMSDTNYRSGRRRQEKPHMFPSCTSASHGTNLLPT
jgi:hypothetical protein